MKKLGFALALVGAGILAIQIQRSKPIQPAESSHRGSAYESEAREGTEDDSHARAEYEWMRLRDPATNRIPAGIAHRELAFAEALAKNADVHALTSAEDWVARGPNNIGGRTRALGIDVTNENNILAGSVTSGMFKSTDGGNSWIKTTAPGQLHSATSVVQNRAAGMENIWYFGTGDRAPFGMNSSADGLTQAHHRGDGIFKSTDGGGTWVQLASTASYSEDQTNDFDFVYRLVTFGENSIVAATASGIHTSTDGGETWSHPVVLPQPERSPDVQVAKGPDGTLYATIAGDGSENGVYRSTDGLTWENFTPGDWPASTLRAVIGPAPSNANVVYFWIDIGSTQQRLRKYDKNLGWTDLTGGLPFNAQMATYDGILMVLGVRPDDENTFFLGGIDLFRTVDGGQTFELISGHGALFHVDQTAIQFYPSNPARMIVGNDGGLFRVENNKMATSGDNLAWESLNEGYRTSQYYTVAVDHGTPGSEVILGGTQDNGVTYTASSDASDPWQIILGGDGGMTAIADGGDYMYFSLAATFRIFRRVGQQLTNISPTGVPLGLFLTPLQLDPHDQKVMYVGSQRAIWRNSDLTTIPHVEGGTSTLVNWESLSNVNDYYVTAFGMSEAEPHRLYYGAFDENRGAHVFRIDNPHVGQPSPVDITSEDFPFYPYSPWIGRIAVDPRDGNKLFVVFPSYGVISIFASEDGGASWTPVSGNLEQNPDGTGSGPSVRWLSILYVQDQPVYLAGTSVGLYSATVLDGMNTKWAYEARTSIGRIVVDMIDVRQSDGFTAVATHGNGVYTTYITTVPTANEDAAELPGAFEIAAAYPNPFTSSTRLEYTLPDAGSVSVGAFDVNGRKVARVFDGMQTAGRHQVDWHASDLANGVYFIRVDYAGTSRTEKVVLQR